MKTIFNIKKNMPKKACLTILLLSTMMNLSYSSAVSAPEEAPATEPQAQDDEEAIVPPSRLLLRGSLADPMSPKMTNTRKLESPTTTVVSRMPDESAPHLGTWLQWPHPYTYGNAYRNRIEQTWVDMTDALVSSNSEDVYIIVYNTTIRNRAQNLLVDAGVSLDRVYFFIIKTDDVWARDDGPMFVENVDDSQQQQLQIIDWGFNGWGNDAPYQLDNRVPTAVANQLNLPVTNLNNQMVLEGGAVEIDGRGTLMATRSSVLENGRNPNLSQSDVENYMYEYMGVSNVIWLNGEFGGTEDITDTHIDGFARFANPYTVVTMNRKDLKYWGISKSDINTLYQATDVNGDSYEMVYLPLTARNVKTTYGTNLGYKGSYVNFYTANNVVLIPAYDDPNDVIARDALQQVYPDRTVVSVDVRNLYKNGGMIHCVTQQEPAMM